MIETFTNQTVRSASDLLADLRASRQLRHVSNEQLQEIVHFFFGDVEHALLENERLPGTNRFFVWTQEAFEEAVSVHGYCCDTCGEVSAVAEDRWRYAAERLLQNLDGQARLCLCRVCSSRFSTFCWNQFQREVRGLWTRELEQMMLAFVASELGREARRVMAGKKPRKRKDACVAAGENRFDRTPIAKRLDGSGSIALGGRQPEHSATI